MKKLILALTFIATAALAADTTPFQPHVDARFKKLENEQTLRVIYDVARDGGDTGTRNLAAKLPAKALITQAWYYIVTQFTDSGTGTVALFCEDENNILTARDITSYASGTIKDTNNSGTAPFMVASIVAPCSVNARVSGAAQLTGKMITWIKYVITD